nr:transcription factor sfp1 [Quercus suber]
MTGTSPYNFQSPSFHSSSYLPKMEANYMKDYVCCDIRLDSMHELLQHYEEAHAQQPTQTMGRTPKDQQFPSTRAANATSTAAAVQMQSQFQQPHLQDSHISRNGSIQPAASPLFSGQSADHVAFDNLDDMDMDDSAPALQAPLQGSQFQPQPQFGRQQPRGPAVNVNLANAFQGPGMQTPTTPRAGQQGMGLPNNPTVSSVNTPTLGTQTASQQTATPDSSMPGTPAEAADMDYSQLGNLSTFDYNQIMQGNYDMNNLQISNGNNASCGTIDDPAKRLLSKQGYGNKGFPNPALANSSELAKRIRENQLLNGLAGVGGFVGEEIKPFKCPVIGCEKAYKNQNGLKYHKQHGHQNQQLKENPDGTFSIVDPTTSIPYPGTVGMEKEKPYRCEVCGKRYKNLNGLKYHRQHSPPCNPELKMNKPSLAGMPTNVQDISVNVAGAGVWEFRDDSSLFLSGDAAVAQATKRCHRRNDPSVEHRQRRDIYHGRRSHLGPRPAFAGTASWRRYPTSWNVFSALFVLFWGLMRETILDQVPRVTRERIGNGCGQDHPKRETRISTTTVVVAVISLLLLLLTHMIKTTFSSTDVFRKCPQKLLSIVQIMIEESALSLPCTASCLFFLSFLRAAISSDSLSMLFPRSLVIPCRFVSAHLVPARDQVISDNYERSSDARLSTHVVDAVKGTSSVFFWT